MKKIIAATFAILLVMCAIASAAQYKTISFSITGVNTNTTAKTDFATKITGQPISFSFTAGTNMVVTLKTAAGYGISLATAKTLANTTNQTYQVNITPALYMGLDRVIMSAHSADGAGFDVQGRLLYEE